MYAAQVAELGRTRKLFDKPLHPYTQGLLEAFPSIHGAKEHLLGIPGSPPDLLRPPSGCRFAPRCPHVFDRCHAKPPRLYEVENELVRCFLHEQAVEPVPAQREGVA
jgi:peptide/nickel transport system ATP-binding protein